MKVYRAPPVLPDSMSREERVALIQEIARTAEDEFQEKYFSLGEWFERYDPLHLLAYCCSYFVCHPAGVDPEVGGGLDFHPYHLEILQAFALMQERSLSDRPLGMEAEGLLDVMSAIGQAAISRGLKANIDQVEGERERNFVLSNIRTQTMAVRNPGYPHHLHRITRDLAATVREDFMLPVIRELDRRGARYRGVLYCGLMLTDRGPRVLEFNCRFGDPETQVVMPQLLTDPVEVMLACANGNLDDAEPVRWSSRPAVAVVMVSHGYPGSYQTGFPISGLNGSDADSGSMVFHAGARLDDDGETVLTTGGRVLACVGTGESVDEARDRAYRRAAEISFQGAYYRGDIAAEAVAMAATGR